MSECPNCGYCSYVPGYRCGCTQNEQLEVARIKEQKRREELTKQGCPVVVDHITREKNRTIKEWLEGEEEDLF